MDETTTLTDDEILTVEDGEITQTTDDADGDDTDNDRWRLERRRRGRLRLGRRVAPPLSGARSSRSRSSGSSRSTGSDSRSSFRVARKDASTTSSPRGTSSG